MTELFNMELTWKRQSDDFDIKSYNREHTWEYEHFSLPASAPAQYKGQRDLINPELGFISSISSCHILTFLAIASRSGYVVNSYQDKVEGTIENNRFIKVSLSPFVLFDPDKMPDEETFQELHKKTQRHCIIANSCATDIVVLPKMTADQGG
jgi:organic hydroperoxide reductase OsmC/OhrA